MTCVWPRHTSRSTVLCCIPAVASLACCYRSLSKTTGALAEACRAAGLVRKEMQAGRQSGLDGAEAGGISSRGKLHDADMRVSAKHSRPTK
jgi:hypothetical protein